MGKKRRRKGTSGQKRNMSKEKGICGGTGVRAYMKEEQNKRSREEKPPKAKKC